MSVRVMTAVWEDAPFEGPTLLLLLALADAANDEGICWPTIPTLQHKTRQPERTVYRGIKLLTESGWLEKVGNPGRGKSNYYRVVYQLVKGATGAPFDLPEKVHTMQEKVHMVQRKGAYGAVAIRKNRKGTVRNRNYAKFTNFLDEREQIKRVTGVSYEQ